MFLVSQADGCGLGGINPSSPAQALPAKVQAAPWALEERWDVTGLQSQFHNVLACWAHVPSVFPTIATGARGPFLPVGCVAARGQFWSLPWPLGVGL